ncbi:TrmH family RNA methyltransferase [Geminicoccaceae bacterium 1502E]|nr:TrmH family RNA methyltransferase [Geminicoccaceae bacterium 1502E]
MPPMTAGGPAPETLAKAVREAHGSGRLAILEGLHPLKHALRFGGEIEFACTPDKARLLELAAALAPDILPALEAAAVELPEALFRGLTPRPLSSPVLAVARRPLVDTAALVAAHGGPPTVLLEDPAHLGNLGAVIRVAAGAGAASVLTTGPQDPWHPAALRGAAGLHWALPVARLPALPSSPRPIVALHPEGLELCAGALPEGAILAFGSERRGLSPELLARARYRFAIPMRDGVSSLNLATAVAVALYAWRLRPAPG